ncbi:MAG TPA: hypothetical protein VGV38_13030 [Pyrinomonadaceae bacterium]|nr:hypothetical protein [Pyrinomonadaceae bacterium]
MSKQVKRKRDAEESVKKAEKELSDDESSSSVEECPYVSKDKEEEEDESSSGSEEVEDEEAVSFYKKQGSKKPAVATREGMVYRRGRYLSSRGKKEPQSFKAWKESSYKPALKGGRPGRGGGPHQKGRRLKLEEQGYENIESVELNGRYPDMRKQIGEDEDGEPLYEYVEVGKMNLDGTPCARELTKLKDSVKALKPGERMTFVANDGRSVSYPYGTKPSQMDELSGPKKSAEQRDKDCEAVAKEMGTLKQSKKVKVEAEAESESEDEAVQED